MLLTLLFCHRVPLSCCDHLIECPPSCEFGMGIREGWSWLSGQVPSSVADTHSRQPQASGQISNTTCLLAAPSPFRTLPTSPSVPVPCSQGCTARTGLGWGLNSLKRSDHLSLCSRWILFAFKGCGILMFVGGTFRGSVKMEKCLFEVSSVAQPRGVGAAAVGGVTEGTEGSQCPSTCPISGLRYLFSENLLETPSALTWFDFAPGFCQPFWVE